MFFTLLNAFRRIQCFSLLICPEIVFKYQLITYFILLVQSAKIMSLGVHYIIGYKILTL